ncbi:MAG: helix-turn-helix domain-containing protein [Proteobacteria bacterium]|nr:helix-turn-helix domain-containing protein [Pseudomonadota bacterium]
MRVLEQVVIAAPASRTAAAKTARPAPTPAPLPKRNAKRTLQVVRSEDRSLTVEETAELMSVSVKTLEAWRRLGKGPEFVKLGRSVRYTMHALDAFTRARTVRNSAEGRMLDVQK